MLATFISGIAQPPLAFSESLFAPQLPVASQTVNYDGQNRATVVYDASSKTALCYDVADVLAANEYRSHPAGARPSSIYFAKFLAAETTAEDSQYFISSGVRRSLSSQMNGVNQIPATIVQEGRADIQTTLNLNQLYSPKFEVPADSRLLNIQPPIQVPIEVQPLGIPGQPASIPLNQVKIVPP
jgi:hypothetical protein